MLAAAVSCKKTPKELPFPETEEEMEESLKTTAAIDSAAEEIIEEALTEADYGTMDADALARELEKIEGVASAYVESEDVIVIKQNDGIHINVFLDSYKDDEEEEDVAFHEGFDIVTKATVNGKEASIPGGDISNKQGRILVPGYEYFTDKLFGDSKERIKLIDSWRPMMERFGYIVDPPYKDSEATTTVFVNQELAPFHAIILAGEGKHDATLAGGKGKADIILTSIKISDVKKNSLYTLFNTPIDPSRTSVLAKIKGGTYYCITPDQLDQALPDEKDYFDNTWVFLLSSYSAASTDFSKALFKSGVAAFTGFNGKIKKTEALQLATNFISYLGAGYEIGQAYRLTQENTLDDKGRELKTSDLLVCRKADEDQTDGKPFYLFNPAPYNLMFVENESSLRWDMRPSLSDHSFEIIVKKEGENKGKTIYKGDGLQGDNNNYRFTYKPEKNGTYEFQVIATILGQGGNTPVSYASETKTFTVSSIKEYKPAHLVADPQEVHFSDIKVGAYALQYIDLTNTGELQLKINNVTNPDGFLLYYDGMETLEPGKTEKYAVWFTPQRTGSYSGDIVIYSNADNDVVRIPVSGTGVESTKLLSVSEDYLNFGTYTIGGEAFTYTVTVKNVGNSDVVLKKVECPAGFRSDFTSAVTLTATDEIPVTFSFAPQTAGTYNGTVKIVSDATNSPLTIDVAGVAKEDYVPLKGVSITPSQLEMEVGQTKQLTINFSPSNASNKKVTWASSNDAVLTVTDNGLVKAVGAGSALAFIVTDDGGYRAYCNITVKGISGNHEGTGDENWD